MKKGKRYRYYVSSPLITETAAKAKSGQRLPAASLEPIVTERIRAFLADPVAVLDASKPHLGDVQHQQSLVEGAKKLAKSLLTSVDDARRNTLRLIIQRIQVHDDRIDIFLHTTEMLMLFENASEYPKTAEANEMAPVKLTIVARLRRTGVGKRFVMGNGSNTKSADPGLLRLIARAHAIRDRLLADTSLTFKEIATEEGVSRSYATRLFRLSFLAPDIVAAILNGDHPPELTSNALIQQKHLPFDWNGQRKSLDFN